MTARLVGETKSEPIRHQLHLGVPAFVRVGLAALAGTAAIFTLVSCSMMDADSCADIGNMSKAQIETKGCNGGFLSAKNQRDSVYEGDDSARLWTGEAPRKGDVIDTSVINRAPAPRNGQPFTGYVGTLRVNYTPDPKALGTDVDNLKTVKGAAFDSNEMTTLKFDKADMSYFLKQVLGGVLGVNYSAPDDVAGKVTFYTEQPIPKVQVLQVVRDILARNGYEMRFLNGVYQIGRPEALAALAQTAAAGRAGEQVTRIIKIQKGSTTEIAAFVKELAGDEVSLSSANGGDSVIVHAPPGQIDQISDLIQSLAAGGVGEDRIAIIPLHQSSPGRIATELGEFYKERFGGSKADNVTILPLEHQQALLVGTRDRRIMAGVRELVQQLDREGGDEISLRIVPLVNINADEVVGQLNAIFGTSGSASTGDTTAKSAATPAGRTPPTAATGIQTPTSSHSPQLQSPLFGDEDPAPAAAGPAAQSNANQPGANQRATSRASAAASAGPAGATGDGMKIVADTRNNAVLVYSTYSMFTRVRDFLKTVDVQQAQVVIEATVAEVDITDGLQYGVESYLQANGLMAARSGTDPTPTDPSVGGAALHGTAQFGHVKLDVVLSALQSVTKVKVISSPYLSVVDGKTARLVIGDQIPFANRTVNSTTQGTATVTQEVEVKDTGILLEVTPKIHSDNSVLLNVNQTVSKPDSSASSGNLTPVISTREVKSDVIVESGRTILIGGLIQDRLDRTVSSVPVLGKLPVVGDLFNQKSDTSTRVELIIMITPRVIRRSAEIENVTRMLRAQVPLR